MPNKPNAIEIAPIDGPGPGETGQAVLIDFDLAVLAELKSSFKPDGQFVGTLSYMAPEQTGRTGHAVDQRADLYSLGATLYEMTTGRPPFEPAAPCS